MSKRSSEYNPGLYVREVMAELSFQKHLASLAASRALREKEQAAAAQSQQNGVAAVMTGVEVCV